MSFLNLDVYQYIRQMILTNRVTVGERLSEARIADELDVSRTPVREAIRQLCHEGLLHQVPSSGTFVVLPGEAEIIEAYEVREALECAMLRKSIRKFLPRHRIELRRYLREMLHAVRAMRDAGDAFLTGEPLARFLDADQNVHALILEVAGNNLALRIVSNAQVRNRIFGNTSHRRNLAQMSRVLLLHARFTRAICQGNGKAAVHWMRTHIRESCNEAVAAFAKQAKKYDTRLDPSGAP
jgi:DNA-binding GntR family transcriptional regulator